MSRFTPADIDELRDAVAEALAAEEPLELVGGGSKRGLGRPCRRRIRWICPHVPYPGLCAERAGADAGAATPLAEIERVLAEHGQMLASSRRAGAACSAPMRPHRPWAAS